MTDTSAENAPPVGPSVYDNNDGSRRPEDRFPPKFVWWKKVVLGFIYVAQIAALIVVVDQFWFQILPSCTCGAYIGFGALLVGLFLDRYLRHKMREHRSRLTDPSEVYLLFCEVDTVEPRLTDPVKPDDNYDKKVQLLKDEVNRLKNLGPEGWTEYQVLCLDQMLVDFFKVDDLQAQAQIVLAELGDYAEDSAYRYDKESFQTWKSKIDEAISKINKNEKATPSERDDAAEELRANQRALLEHLASYEKNWAEGSTLVRGLMIWVAAAIPILLVMGLVPFLHPAGDGDLGVLNWGFLGIGGSLTAVLLSLRKSDVVEVGNTEGRKELWRALLGGILGFVAGVLIYAMIWGGLLPDQIVPKFLTHDLKDIGLSILWAVGSGFSFERVFVRMRDTLEGVG